jgi:hypothetical protein
LEYSGIKLSAISYIYSEDKLSLDEALVESSEIPSFNFTYV